MRPIMSQNFVTQLTNTTGTAQWLECWENVLLLGKLSALTLILVCVPPLCYCSST